jgi:hypothetical protein
MAGQAARMEVKNSYQILGVVPEATRSIGDLDVDGRTILPGSDRNDACGCGADSR